MSDLSPVERHWLERGGTHLKMFLVFGWTPDCHAAASQILAPLAAYADDDVRHAIESTATHTLEVLHPGLSDLTGEWSDYVLPPHIDEGDDLL